MTCLLLPGWVKVACTTRDPPQTSAELDRVTCPTCRALAKKPQIANQLANAARPIPEPSDVWSETGYVKR